jgi:hypothetical protein
MLVLANSYFYRVLLPVKYGHPDSIYIGNVFSSDPLIGSLVGLQDRTLMIGNRLSQAFVDMGGEGPQCVDNTIEMNYGGTVTNPPITVGGNNAVVLNNVVSIDGPVDRPRPPAIEAFVTTGALVRGNILRQTPCQVTTTVGIALRVANDAVVIGNDIRGNWHVPIVVWFSQNAVVVGNDLRGSAVITPIAVTSSPGLRTTWPNDPTWGDNFT